MAHDVVIDGQTFRRRRPIAVLLLTACTLFVYWVVWYYRINDEARRFLRDDSIRPWRSVLAIVPGLLIIVPPFVSIYRAGERIQRMEKQARVTKTVSPLGGCVLAALSTVTLVFAGGSGYYFQTQLNAVWSATVGDVATR